MINEKEYSEAIVEVLDILKHLDDSILDQIPLDFIKALNSQKSATYVSTIDFTKPLNENNLKHTTKVILTLMYRDYLCANKEKEELIKQLSKNEELKNTNYNTDLFKNKTSISDLPKEDLSLIDVKKNIFQRILDKIFKRD